MHECDRHTDIQMDTTVTSAAMGGIAFSDAAEKVQCSVYWTLRKRQVRQPMHCSVPGSP